MSIRPRTVAFGLLALAVSASLYWFGFGSRQASPTAAPRPWSLGRVTDGHQGITGVRVYADRQPRVAPASPPPLAITDAEGRFRLELAPGDAVLAVEKDGWQRDLVPAAEWSREIVLRPEPLRDAADARAASTRPARSPASSGCRSISIPPTTFWKNGTATPS